VNGNSKSRQRPVRALEFSSGAVSPFVGGVPESSAGNVANTQPHVPRLIRAGTPPSKPEHASLETREKKNNDPTRPCGLCGCQFRYHNPPKTSSSHRASHSFTVVTKALTCCYSCPHCMCFCVGFVEPFEGMPFERCVYEAEDHSHRTLPVKFSNKLSRSGTTSPHKNQGDSG
jgi:hypothetical protein